ncbi:MAG: hypothetical protein LBC19_03065 [Tannerella sp.]|jgi:hypothetical protein|nr:hypothetical protein [Tannerella sp.]
MKAFIVRKKTKFHVMQKSDTCVLTFKRGNFAIILLMFCQNSKNENKFIRKGNNNSQKGCIFVANKSVDLAALR